MDDSIFFPEGGGQPNDVGTLLVKNTSSQSGFNMKVSDAQNVNGICVLTAESSKDKEYVLEELKEEGVIIDQKIDWDKRFDYMTQHSAQHLISANALNEPFEIQTHSFSLNKKGLTSYIDFKIDPDIELEQNIYSLSQVEQIANKYIMNNLSMKARYIDPNDEDDMVFFKENVRSRLLPKSEDGSSSNGLGNKIRLMEIENGVDLNTCCGTHVKTLGQLQMIKFVKIEKVKSTILRVHFAAAKRLFQLMNESVSREATITNLLSCTKDEYVDRIVQMMEDKKEKEKLYTQTNAKLCGLIAKDIRRNLEKNDNISVIDLEASYDMSFMTSLANTVIGNIGGTDGVLLLLVEGKEVSNEGTFLLVGDEDLVSKASGEIKIALDGRGGGARGKFQGKGSNIRSGLGNAKKILKRIKAVN